MVVIADTSPLNYLILIGEVEVLPRLYGRVVIPSAVWQEMRSSETPALVAQFAAQLPNWAKVQSPAADAASPLDPSLARLGKGERAAILLAQQQVDQGERVLLLMDERPGRREVKRRQFPAIGTLGVLQVAALRGWLDLPACLARLRQTNFREPRALVAELLAEEAARRRQQGGSEQ